MMRRWLDLVDLWVHLGDRCARQCMEPSRSVRIKPTRLGNGICGEDVGGSLGVLSEVFFCCSGPIEFQMIS